MIMIMIMIMIEIEMQGRGTTLLLLVNPRMPHQNNGIMLPHLYQLSSEK